MGPNGDEVPSSRSILWFVGATRGQRYSFALAERVQIETVRLEDEGSERVEFSGQVGIDPR